MNLANSQFEFHWAIKCWENFFTTLPLFLHRLSRFATSASAQSIVSLETIFVCQAWAVTISIVNMKHFLKPHPAASTTDTVCCHVKTKKRNRYERCLFGLCLAFASIHIRNHLSNSKSFLVSFLPRKSTMV